MITCSCNQVTTEQLEEWIMQAPKVPYDLFSPTYKSRISQIKEYVDHKLTTEGEVRCDHCRTFVYMCIDDIIDYRRIPSSSSN